MKVIVMSLNLMAMAGTSEVTTDYRCYYCN